MAREVHKKRTSAMPAAAHVIYEPVATDIHDNALRALFQRWQADLAAGRRVPGEEILKYPEAAPLLRNLMLLEVIRDDPSKLDYRYRVYGTEIARAYGQDMTGRLTSEFPSGVASFFAELYETAIRRRIVIHSLHSPPMSVNVTKWERLIFPLGDPEVKWLLVVNIAKGKRREG